MRGSLAIKVTAIKSDTAFNRSEYRKFLLSFIHSKTIKAKEVRVSLQSVLFTRP